MSFAVGCIAGAIVFMLGWDCAHSTVAKECERLGGFYVGKKIYKCVEVKNDDALS